MKKGTLILAVVCYIIAVLAMIEGVVKDNIMMGIITAGLMWWVGSSLRKEALRYE
jgi:hypothetical protein